MVTAYIGWSDDDMTYMGIMFNKNKTNAYFYIRDYHLNMWCCEFDFKVEKQGNKFILKSDNISNRIEFAIKSGGGGKYSLKCTGFDSITDINDISNDSIWENEKKVYLT